MQVLHGEKALRKASFGPLKADNRD